MVLLKRNPLLWRSDFRYLAPLLNCHRNLVEMTSFTMTVTSCDERSLSTRYRPGWHVINRDGSGGESKLLEKQFWNSHSHQVDLLTLVDSIEPSSMSSAR
jgi:hypothetical protein